MPETATPPSRFKRFQRNNVAEIRTYVDGEDLYKAGVSIAIEDARAGSPRRGDMIARNPENHADQWLISAYYFAKNFTAIRE